MIGTSLTLAWELAIIALPSIVPVQFILAGPLFAVIGGGNTVLIANIYSIASDLVVQSDRYALTDTRLVNNVISNIYKKSIYILPHGIRHSSWCLCWTSYFIHLYGNIFTLDFNLNRLLHQPGRSDPPFLRTRDVVTIKPRLQLRARCIVRSRALYLPITPISVSSTRLFHRTVEVSFLDSRLGHFSHSCTRGPGYFPIPGTVH